MPSPDVIEWFAEWARDSWGEQRGLKLLTAHRAKGLEFDDVVILDGGWEKPSRNEDPDAPRRLFYVAMTRARRNLPAVHRLAELDAVALEQLDDEPLGVLQPTHEHHRELKRRFEADGLRFRPLLESQTFLPILEFVAAEHCCAVLDPLTVAHVMQAGFAAEVVVRRLADPMR